MVSAIPCLAQEREGISFQSDSNWSQIKEKAKKENKYIFVDIYTTWCGPCREMDRDIFSQKKVGDYFNANFINVKVQMDSTANDNSQIKKWYHDAKLIKQEYQVNIYPTYLFLNPEGILVHVVKGATKSADNFIANSIDSFDSTKQNVNLLKEFENGRRDSSFLKFMIKISEFDFKNRPKYVQEYLKTQTNLLTSQNIQFIVQSASSSKDIGYDILINHPMEVNKVVGEQWRNDVINDIVFEEYILPRLRIGGKKEILEGGAFTYTGEINNVVDWPALKDSLQSKFKDRYERLLINAKTNYYSWNKDWKNLNKSLLAYSLHNDNIEEDLIANWLQYFIVVCEEKKYFSDALIWSSSIPEPKNLTIIKNRGLMLYKVGKRERGVKMMLQYQNMLPKPSKEIAALITKMQNGQEID